MTFETIRIRRLSDGIARLTLNRPDKLNSFTDARCTPEAAHGAVDCACPRNR